jgi:hypothetical protein
MTPAHLPPDDADLARLLGDAVCQDVEGPVDSHRLVVGAQAMAARIRRRRRTGLAVLAAVVLAGVPVGLIRVGSARQVDVASSAGSAASAASAASAGSSAAASAMVVPSPSAGDQQPQVAADSAAESRAAAATSPTRATPRVLASSTPSAQGLTPRSPTASPLRLVPVPDGALLVPQDLPQVALTSTSDTANRQLAGATPDSATCGQSLPAPSAAVGGRMVTYQRHSGPAPTWWLLSSTVRVYPGISAQTYLAAAHRLACATTSPGVGDDALRFMGRLDSTGRTHYYAVVRVGRTVSEIILIVPRGGQATGSDLTRLLAVAAGRLKSSGLVASAAADPALGG